MNSFYEIMTCILILFASILLFANGEKTKSNITQKRKGLKLVLTIYLLYRATFLLAFQVDQLIILILAICSLALLNYLLYHQLEFLLTRKILDVLSPYIENKQVNMSGKKMNFIRFLYGILFIVVLFFILVNLKACWMFLANNPYAFGFLLLILQDLVLFEFLKKSLLKQIKRRCLDDAK